jgi:diaminopimelate decarboxylase
MTDIDRLPAVAARLRKAARHGTPVFVTDLSVLRAAAEAIERAFPDPWVRQYSLKANDVTAVVAALWGRGFGANVVSRGEWAIARRAGIPNERISLEGIGKSSADLAAAVAASRSGVPLAWVSVESPDEIRALASRLGRRRPDRPVVDVLLRLNPAVVPETAGGLAVGASTSKFGMTETELTAAVERALADGLRPRGIHLHVGSQLGAVDAWRDAVRRGLALLGLVRGGLPSFDTLDVGGGFPVAPLGMAAPSPERFAHELPALLDAVPPERRPGRLVVEPGRALVARAGWLVASVLHVRDRDPSQVVLDAGMTELIRPALYGARHEVVALTSLGRALDGASSPADPSLMTARVEGPICESTDSLGEHLLPPLRRGDLVAIRDAGAYGASMASTYNGRSRPAQLLLEADGRLRLVRRRGSLRSLG